MRERLVLKRDRKKRLEQGHPWIYRSEVQDFPSEVTQGEVVDVVNHQGVFLAKAFFNPASQIIGRVVAYGSSDTISRKWLQQRIEEAYLLRRRFLPDSSSFRAVFGEADLLPGLIVDKFEDVLVVQILSAGMERLKDDLCDVLIEVFQPTGIYLRNDVPVRELEGLDQETGTWYGEVPDEVAIREHGLQFVVDVKRGQKTGYFLDQTDNRAAIRPIVDGARVLDCFSHTGSFAVHAAHYGAKQVIGVDISEDALSVAKKNGDINGLGGKIEWVAANAFDYLRQAQQEGQTFDVVMLDPPAFAKSRSALTGAKRGYKDINLRGMKLVKDGGYLVTSSCSYHMLPGIFRDTILDAATDARKILRLIHFSGAGADHPELEGVPEGNYLKFAIYQVTSRG